MARSSRDSGRGSTPSGAGSRGLETPSRTPSEALREGPGRVPAVGRRNLDDVRADVRDTTRTKQRRKATVAQKAARDRAGNTKTRARASERAVSQQRPAGERRPPGPNRAGGAAKAARARVPKPGRKALPVRKDDFERLNLREDGGKERTIERSHAPERGLPTRELPDNEARRAVEARHVYHVDREQEAALRAVRDGVPEPGRVTDNLIRDGFAREEERGVRMTRTGERVLRRVERARSTDDSRGGLTRVQLDARYELSAAQQRALSDLGSFHIAREDAISRNIYDDTQRASAQIDELKANGLLQELRLRDQRDITYLALTPAGRDVVAKAHHDASHIHTGIARPSQARHDAAVYDAYQHAERAIRADGGTVRRIQLEGDLKAEIRREAYISAAKSLREQGLDIAAVTDPERNLAIREATVPIARSHGLPVDDDGAVIYPDMQLEIDRPDGTVGRCNVEVITEHYSAASVAAKQSAGFQLYLPQASSGARSGGGGVPVQPLAEELLDF